MVVEITDNNWAEEVTSSPIPVLVDFWASWCGPCQMMKPVFEELSEDFDGKVKFVKCNVEDHQDLAGENGIMGIPALLMFKNGQEVGRITGFAPKEALRGKINALLQKI